MKIPNRITRETLESLSQDELAELILVAEETNRINQVEVKFIPRDGVQKAFHKSDRWIRALFSGNGFGKTCSCINEAIWYSTGTHPYRTNGRVPNTIIIVLDNPSKADTVWWQEILDKKWYDPERLKKLNHGRSHTSEVIFPNGSNWLFMTHEMNEDRWESIQCDAVIFDEPPPRFIYAALVRGMRKKGSKPWMAFAGTPRGRNAPWMYKEIYRPWKFQTAEHIECFFGDSIDNIANLEEGTIERYKQTYNEREWATRLHGKFEFLSGVIFDTFDRKEHVEEDFSWPYSWPVILAMDPHLRKNHVAVLIGIDPDKELHVIRELETSLAGKKACEFFIRACEGYNVRFGICDNFGSIKNLEGDKGERKSFIDTFNEVSEKMESRIRIRPTTRKEKRDDEWIEDMRDWLNLEPDFAGQNRSRFHIFESCLKTVDNFESYVWDEHKGAAADGKDVKETPLGMDCDFLMCIKYGIAIKPAKLGDDKIYRKPPRKGYATKEYESRGGWSKD